jgi:hypothetical protein
MALSAPEGNERGRDEHGTRRAVARDGSKGEKEVAASGHDTSR